jgi:DAACS family dicarboxylate/amino acid:cation (Na+ or H+) symporter
MDPVDDVPDRPKKRRNRVPFVARILVAMAAGTVVGLVFGPRVARLGELGTVIIDLIKGLAGPLLFFAVVDAFLRTHVRTRSAALMVAISLTNAAIAVVIGLTLSNTLRPGERRSVPSSAVVVNSAQARPRVADPSAEVRTIDFLRELEGYLPRNVVRPFLDNSVITIVVLAVLTGASLRHVKNEQARAGERGYETVEAFVATAFRTTEVMLGAVITLVPLAVFGVVAQTASRVIEPEGMARLQALGWYVSVALLGLAIQVLVVYQAWVVLVARASLRWFWSGARDALVYALGASSSLATLPVTLRCLDRMGVSPQSARLAACVGTNLNNDGILLYEAMAVLFVAQFHGIELSFGRQSLAAASCVIAGIGIAAVPDAGLISLSLVLATVGLPVEILPLLLTVDWLLSRCRAVTNVTSDILVAVLLDRFGAGRGEPLPEPVPPEWDAGPVAASARS